MLLCVIACVYGQEVSFQELVLSYSMVPGDQTQVIRLSSKHPT